MLHQVQAATDVQRRGVVGDRSIAAEDWQARAIAIYRKHEATELSTALLRAIRILTGQEVGAERVWVDREERSAGVVVDGVHFRWEHDRLVLLRPCVHCGIGQVASPALHSQADLGYALAVWQPHHPGCQAEDLPD